LASASSDNTVKVWDAETGQELRTLKGHSGGVRSVAFSPDGKRLASYSFAIGPLAPVPAEAQLKVWDAVTGKELWGHTGKGNYSAVAMVFSPNGKRLVIAGKVWDAQTGQELFSLEGDRGDSDGVAFSPDGK